MFKYPSSLVPKDRYKLEIDISELSIVDDIYIIRRLDCSPDQVYNRFGNIEPMVLSEDDIPDMSMNLLGGKFVIPNLKFRLDKKSSQKWIGGKTKVKNFSDNIHILTTYCGLFIPLKTIHNISVPFRTQDSPQVRKNYKGFAFEKSYPDEIITEHGRAFIEHDPSVLNYWHIVLTVTNFFDGKPLKNAKSKMNHAACRSIIDSVLTTEASINKPELIGKIQKHYYATQAIPIKQAS